jgi:hypothetical protein
VTLAGHTVTDLKDADLDCPIVGGAGTSTFALEAAAAFMRNFRSALTSSWTPTTRATTLPLLSHILSS